MSRRVVISGLGTVGPWGADRAGLMAALTAGAAPLTPFGPAVGRLSGGRDGVDATPLALPPHARWAGVVDGSCLAPWVPGREARRMSRPSRFAVAAARAALADADFAVPDGGLDDLGVILSTAYGPAAVTEELLAQILLDGPEAASPFLFAESVANAPAAQVARLTGARGANLTITQREAGALIAVRRAADAIAAERSERMFAGVADRRCSTASASSLRAMVATGRSGRSPGPSTAAGTGWSPPKARPSCCSKTRGRAPPAVAVPWPGWPEAARRSTRPRPAAAGAPAPRAWPAPCDGPWPAPGCGRRTSTWSSRVPADRAPATVWRR